ncbi:BZ3500_MvSof-1268-A1-R1_Chr1-3g01660 [Microbotryum saponariae]|uniref:BZ3500_MvSof-1268-A1-R1_Chr1-3g01660 protein n=1 Tax=Microbotryum saponariae TaxID=289078 RepID=A0A2X0KGI4_9BASI|nr:BZ3500_MvSof-1268-A1-R1_Chr1-3g01660 [Microbotryum saponariae]SCZ94261.1 BZ3501_MvSof-1269-A2-R1_Chr1-3g01261 [Microbotryum saponariae]
MQSLGPRAASSRAAGPSTVVLTPLTARSSSTTRLSQLDVSTSSSASLLAPSSSGSGSPPPPQQQQQQQSEAYRAWRRDSKERIEQQQHRRQHRQPQPQPPSQSPSQSQLAHHRHDKHHPPAYHSALPSGVAVPTRSAYPPSPRSRSAHPITNGSESGSSTRNHHYDRPSQDKAVSFVIGAPLSDSTDDEDDARARDGASKPSKRPTPRSTPVRGRATGSGAVQSESSSRVGDAQAIEDPTEEYTIEDVIRLQIAQPIHRLDPNNFDALLKLGIGDYTFSLRAAAPGSAPASAPSAIPSAGSSPAPPLATQPHPDRVSLGKGKFSEVLLAQKENTSFALKHTPLYSHHPLIASRLLREPTILAQLLPHPNLVKVYETIRTPGHFYLVEENLQSSVTLEQLVASYPDGILPLPLAWSVLRQLASVVRSLHEPLRVCHRDIKPENILVHVSSSPTDPQPTLMLKLLDFGLATHFSASEAKLTTCCGSPAYHSPELWRGLREPSGAVRYWGPEVDIWCVGLTVLRCLSPSKYPLGIAHSSLIALADKVVDALLVVKDDAMRQTLAVLLEMDGSLRMRSFEQFCLRKDVQEVKHFKMPANAPRTTPNSPAVTDLSSLEASPKDAAGELLGQTEAAGEAQAPSRKEFKSTTFIPMDPQYFLDLPLLSSSDVPDGPRPLQVCAVDGDAMPMRSRSPSRTRLSRHRHSSSLIVDSADRLAHELATPDSPAPAIASDLDPSVQTNVSVPATPLTPQMNMFASLHDPYPPPIELLLANPTHESIYRATSYIKYALRCAGILYHVREEARERRSSVIGYDAKSSPPTATNSVDLDDSYFCHLECVVRLPDMDLSSKASSALMAALRPPMSRAHTTGGPNFRSSSTPAARDGRQPRQQEAGAGKKKVEEVSALTFFLSIRKAAPPFRRRHSTRRRTPERISVQLSDARALKPVRDALRFDSVSKLPGAKSSDLADTSDLDRRGRLPRGEDKQTTFRGTHHSAERSSRDRRPMLTVSLSTGPKGHEPRTSALGLSTGPLADGEVTPRRQGFFDFVAGWTKASGAAEAKPARTPSSEQISNVEAQRVRLAAMAIGHT